jgi:predicted ATPase
VGLQTQIAALDALESLLAHIRKGPLQGHRTGHAADAESLAKSPGLQSESSPEAADASSKADVPTDVVQNPPGREDSRKTAATGSYSGDSGIRGVYLWGPVGSGKTMLMDLLATATGSSVHSAESTTEWKVPRMLRVHFHEFMLTVHSRMHELQQALPRRVSGSRDGLPVYR